MTSFLLYVEEKLVKVNYEGKIRGDAKNWRSGFSYGCKKSIEVKKAAIIRIVKVHEIK